MIYSIDELRQKVAPVAVKYELSAVYVFGSYARNEATENSDVDIMVDRTCSKVKSMFDMGGLYNDLCASIEKKIDLITTNTLEQESSRRRTPGFVDNVRMEMVKLYE